jgi:hypothetical protein
MDGTAAHVLIAAGSGGVLAGALLILALQDEQQEQQDEEQQQASGEWVESRDSGFPPGLISQVGELGFHTVGGGR